MSAPSTDAARIRDLLDELRRIAPQDDSYQLFRSALADAVSRFNTARAQELGGRSQ